MRMLGLWGRAFLVLALLSSPARAGFWEGFADGFNRNFHIGREGGGGSLNPSSLAPGFYKVTAKRKGGDIYEVDGTSYIKTRHCYEYTFGDDAIMEITSMAGYSIGTITFVSSGNSCDIEAYVN